MNTSKNGSRNCKRQAYEHASECGCDRVVKMDLYADERALTMQIRHVTVVFGNSYLSFTEALASSAGFDIFGSSARECDISSRAS